MADLPVLYCDGFEISLSAFGALLRFGARLPLPAQGQPAAPPAFIEQVRLGMGLPHLKLAVAIMVREIMRHEAALKQRIEVPDDVLQSVGLPPAVWGQFWAMPPKQEMPLAPPAGAMALVPQ